MITLWEGCCKKKVIFESSDRHIRRTGNLDVRFLYFTIDIDSITSLDEMCKIALVTHSSEIELEKTCY